ncbi:MAG: carbohydrate binding family 9 domain-containing protein [Gemmatimonadaceae bacterium]|nr:carbohydrate binding family 9 domain-containing protein [Gemmatimonadaceae bacterium]
MKIVLLCLAFAAILPDVAASQAQGKPGEAAVGVTARREQGAVRRLVASPAEGPIVLDGTLDDEAWKKAEVASGFVQSEPNTGQPATEKTEVRVVYSATTLYIGAHLYDGEPDRIIVNQIRKDFNEVEQDDFEVILDTFHDRHNGYVFITNVEGAKLDRQVAGEGREVNPSWDAVWDVKTRRVADGWTVEMAIPFRSLRYDPSSQEPWGVNFSRRIRRKNEVTFWSPIPREYTLSRLSLAGELEGVRPQGAARDIRIKPYALARSVRDVGVRDFTTSGDVGVDVKAGLTRALTLDVTVNPDFAQAEADEQQVNLTQFSQFFPEKREFFLENSGVFYVGDAARNNRTFATLTPDEDMLLFFSRRIGLTSGGTPIPIPGGVRLTGTMGDWAIGALAMQTERLGTTPSNRYTTLRLRRNLAPGSDIGVLYTGRDAVGSAGGYNHAYGADANIRFFGQVDWNSYLVGSDSPGKADGAYTWRTSLNYEGQFLHMKGTALEIGNGFQDDLAYYRRIGVRKWSADIGIRPRPAWFREMGGRELHPHIVWSYYNDLAGRPVGKSLHSANTWFFADGSYTELSANARYEYITDSLRLNRGDRNAQRLAPGGYQWTEWRWLYNSNAARPMWVNLTATRGGLWSGTQTSLNATVTFQPSFRTRIAVGAQHTNARLNNPDQRFTATVWTGRANYSFTTNMFLDALTQYDAAVRQFNANIRFNLIHHPLSDLYIVYNEQRFTTVDAPTPGRSMVLKYTHMFAY